MLCQLTVFASGRIDGGYDLLCHATVFRSGINGYCPRKFWLSPNLSPGIDLRFPHGKIRGQSLMCGASLATVIAVTLSGSHRCDDKHVDSEAWRGARELAITSKELSHGWNSDGAHEE
jgi:hypothetical protein